MANSDTFRILYLLIMPILASGSGNIWFLQPPPKNVVINGTETARIHCQLNRKANEVQWWFRPADEGSHWTTVKLYPNPEYVTKFDKYKRYVVTEQVNMVDNAAVYEYDMTIEPVTWADRGEWKCGIPGLGIQSSIGQLEIKIPLSTVGMSSGGRPNVANGAHEKVMVVDEGADLRVWCRTGAAYPAPDRLEIFIDGNKQTNVDIQSHTSGDGQSSLTGSLLIKRANRPELHDSQVRCRANWGTDTQDEKSVEAESVINVFFPTTQVRVDTQEVVWNELLQARCVLITPANPAPRITWYMDGKVIRTAENVLELRVDRANDMSSLKCVATHTTFATAKKIRTPSEPVRIRVQYSPSGEPKLTQTITRGNELAFECNTSPAYPASHLVVDFAGDNSKLIRNEPVIERVNGGSTISQTITVPADAAFHNKSVTCTEYWPNQEAPVFKMSTEIWALVPHPPEKVFLTVNGKYVDSEVVTIRTGQNKFGCSTIGGYPVPVRSSFLLSVGNERVTLSKDNNVLTGHFLATKKHHKAVLSCSQGNLMAEASLNVTFTSDSLKMKFERQEYNIGDTVRTFISTGPSYPSASISCTKYHYEEEVPLVISLPVSEEAVEPYGSETRALVEFVASRYDHGAIVKCTVNNELTEELKLNVRTPAFFIQNQVFEVAQGNTLIIPVDRLIRANPAPEDITWKRINPKSDELEVVGDDGTEGKRLILPNVKQGDMGEYFVKGGGVSGKINIIVLSDPSLYISGATQIVTGSNLDLTCFAEGRPLPRVYWTRGANNDFVTNGTKLHIPKMSTQMADAYHCHGVNSQNSTLTTVNVVVQHAPNITAPSERVIIYPDGRPLELACKVDAVPPVTKVNFYSPAGDNTPLEKVYKGSLESNGLWVVRFSRPTTIYKGQWTCEAENRLDSNRASIDVVSAGAPEPVTAVTTEAINHRTARVRWTKGNDNGYEQKFRVLVESTDLTNAHTKEYLTFASVLLIRNLTADTDYSLKISAENQLGSSLPFETTYSFTSAQQMSSAASNNLVIYLAAFSILILAILVVIFFFHKKKKMIYSTKKLNDTDGRSLSESENLMKGSSEDESNVQTSREDSLSKQRLHQDPMHYYTLQCHKTLPSPQRIANQMTETDYSPSEQQILHTGDQYGHTTSLCHRHRQYDTMPKLIDTTSGYCSSSNSSYSNSTNGALPRSRSFQASRKKRKSSEGVLV